MRTSRVKVLLIYFVFVKVFESKEAAIEIMNILIASVARRLGVHCNLGSILSGTNSTLIWKEQ